MDAPAADYGQFANELGKKVREFDKKWSKKYSEVHIPLEYTDEKTGFIVRLQFEQQVFPFLACPTPGYIATKIQIVTADGVGVKEAVKAIFDRYNEEGDLGEIETHYRDYSQFKIECYSTIQKRDKAIKKEMKYVKKHSKPRWCNIS